MARFTIRAEREIERDARARPGWLEGITLNTVEPSPVGEASRDGKIALDLGHVRAGTEYVLFLHFQVNPTNVGRRSQDVELHDGETPLLAPRPHGHGLPLMDLVLRAAIAFFFVYLLTRVVGRRELSRCSRST